MKEVKFKSQYSKSFYSIGLNEEKFNLILEKALKIRDFKNNLSERVHENIIRCSKMTKIDFIKEFNTQISGLSGQDIQHAIVAVYVAYENRFKQILSGISFKSHQTWKAVLYKRKTRNHEKGDLKEIKVKWNRTSDLGRVLKFFIRFQAEDRIEEYVKEKLNEGVFKSTEHKLFYQMVLEQINKFGESRLKELAFSKRDRICQRYSNPISFKSLSFSSLNQGKTPILNWNKNFNSDLCNAFISLGAFGETNRDRMEIPVPYSKKYHDDMKLYQKGHNTSYTTTLDEKMKRVRVILSHEGERSIFIEGQNPIGVDVNIKHNMFSLSNGDEIDYDRDLIRDYSKFLKKIDKTNERKEKMNQSSELSKKNQRKFNSWKTKINDMLESKVVQLIKAAKESGFNHIVLEDLAQMGRSLNASGNPDIFSIGEESE